MLSLDSRLFTHPTNSSIILGLFPAATIRVAPGMSLGILCLNSRSRAGLKDERHSAQWSSCRGGSKVNRRNTARLTATKFARSVWSARGLPPLLDRLAVSIAAASWPHSKRFAIKRNLCQINRLSLIALRTAQRLEQSSSSRFSRLCGSTGARNFGAPLRFSRTAALIAR